MIEDKTGRKVVLGLAGDVMIGRGVNHIINQQRYAYPWGNMLDIIRSTDANIVNLEAAITNSNKRVEKVFNFRANPDKIETLKEAKITAVSVANNYILDFSEDGMRETLSLLDDAGIKHAGAGEDELEATKPAIFNVEHITVGLLSYTDNEPGWKAGPHQPGINYIDIDSDTDRRSAFYAVEKLKKSVDLAIVSLHWGPNLRVEPTTNFRQFAHQLVNAGADIIHGHSAHIFQAIEIYKQKLILYDTGDFVDDYMVNPELRNDLSFFFLVTVMKEKPVGLQLVPVRISNCQVNKAVNEDYAWCLTHIARLSKKFGTIIDTKSREVIFSTDPERTPLLHF